MSAPVLVTKLYAPPPRPGAVPRPRLTGRLDAGLHRRLTLVAAPAGFGKTYLVAALRTVAPQLGTGLVDALQSPQPPPAEAVLTALLNELAALPDELVLVLDDYHLVDAEPVDRALAFLVEHLPPRLHLVVATREDPQLPLARLRARGQLTEVRAADLRFTPEEAAEFLKGVMGLSLSAEEIAALE